jgi:hypothetical protein
MGGEQQASGAAALSSKGRPPARGAYEARQGGKKARQGNEATHQCTRFAFAARSSLHSRCPGPSGLNAPI